MSPEKLRDMIELERSRSRRPDDNPLLVLADMMVANRLGYALGVRDDIDEAERDESIELMSDTEDAFDVVFGPPDVDGHLQLKRALRKTGDQP